MTDAFMKKKGEPVGYTTMKKESVTNMNKEEKKEEKKDEKNEKKKKDTKRTKWVGDKKIVVEGNDDAWEMNLQAAGRQLLGTDIRDNQQEFSRQASFYI